VPLFRCLYVLSDSDCDHIAMQLQDYVSQLRDMPRSVGSDTTISNTLGKACMEPRIRGATPIGPFADEAAFSQWLRWPDDPARRGHRILFTHADLNPRNILVDYPEYWEYTKALFEGFRWTKRHNDMMYRIFEKIGNYSREWDIEQRAWATGDAV